MDHQHRLRGFKLSMSFVASVFSVGFYQKTAKEDLFVKGNHIIPQDKQHGKTLEDSRRLSKAEPEPLKLDRLVPHVGRPVPRPTSQPLAFYVGSPPPSRLLLCHLFKLV